MQGRPLIRKPFSNEHLQALFLGALILQSVPLFIRDPSGLLRLIVLCAAAAAVDAILNFIRYKRLLCSVSAVITAAVLFLFAPALPFWTLLAAVAAALSLGKHLWGGTGRNGLNPAVFGLLLVFLVNPETVLHSPYVPWQWFGIVLLLPFAIIRPTVVMAFLMPLAITAVSGFVSPALLYPAVLFGLIVLTDPVTVTSRPLTGAFLGFLFGFFISLIMAAESGFAHWDLKLLSRIPFALALICPLLGLNLVSFLLDRMLSIPRKSLPLRLRIPKALPSGIPVYLDLVDSDWPDTVNIPAVPEITAAELADTADTAGLCGLGGAAFPLAKKIRTVMQHRNPVIIVNAAECDPGLLHDQWLLEQHPALPAFGVSLLQKALNASGIFLAVKKSFKGTWTGPGTVALLPEIYPVGAEKILIEKILGRKLHPEIIPAEEGILVLNVQTAASLAAAYLNGAKSSWRLITVGDFIRDKCFIARVPYGLPLRSVAEKCGLNLSTCFVGGGLMKARSLGRDECVEAGITGLYSAVPPRYKESPQCSRCGLCRDYCPAGLDPGYSAESFDRSKNTESAGKSAKTCMECGSCSFVCPAGKDLMARMISIRKVLA